MKIVIVAPRFPPEGEIGGIEIASQEISKGLVKKGHDVFIIASGEKDIIEKTAENITIYRISNPNIKFFGSLIFWLKIFLALKKIRPDIIHCQTIQMGLPCFLLKRIYRKPYIVWCHGFDVYFPWKFKKIISKIVLNSSDAVVALTNDMKEKLKKNCKKDIFVLPNGVNFKKYKGFLKQAIRDKLKIGFYEKIIVFVGGLRSVKGVKYLIEAFDIINKKIPEARLFLVGDGVERKNLEDIVKKNNLTKEVNFVGKIINQKIPEYMLISDIFVLPSISEGFPLVVLEAMASGLPVVATKVRGLPEIIKDGENGFLVESKNSEQIAEKVLLLLEDDKLREKISNNNKEKSEEYSWEEIVEKIEKIYLKVLSCKNI